MPLIEVRAMTKFYKMGDSIVRALNGVDLDIESGEFLAITGASGSGKSTMMHVLGCLDRPTDGTYRLNGHDVSRLSDAELARTRNQQIGFVFQTFNLINRTSALENVEVPLFYARQSGTGEPARRALERVGLAARASHRSNELSGGERQRVAIARAIVNDPPLLLADEPTGNLDTRTGQQIMQIFRELSEAGVTIILVTHEWDVALQAARIVQMRDGKIVSDRPTSEILAESGQNAAQRHGIATAPVQATAHAHAPSAVAQSDVATLSPETTTEQPASAVDDAQAPAASSAATPQPATPAPHTGDPASVEYDTDSDDAGLGPPRMARGCTHALVWAIIGVAMLVVWQVASRLIGKPDIQPGQPPPIDVIVKGLIAFGAFLAALASGIVAIVISRGALRRIREIPGNWLGKRRAFVAQVLGWLVVLLPLMLVAVSIVIAIRKGIPSPG